MAPHFESQVSGPDNCGDDESGVPSDFESGCGDDESGCGYDSPGRRSHQSSQHSMASGLEAVT